MQKIKVLVKEPNQPWHLREIDNTLEAFQKIVGVYIEQITLDDHVILLCNEEGKLRRLEPNFGLAGDMIVGTAILTFSKSDEFEDVPGLDGLEKAIANGDVVHIALGLHGRTYSAGTLEGEEQCKTKKS